MHAINLLTLLVTFLTHTSIISSYNIVVKNAIVARNRDFSYFGYTVLLRKPWMIVGAPKANFTSIPRGSQAPREPGASYRCNLKSIKCEQFRPSDVNDESGFITQVNYNSLVKKAYGWFGASMALDENDDLITVCAPRTILSIFSILDKHISMHGVCYSGKISSGNLQLEDNFKSHDFLSTFWYNSLHGFSIHYSKAINNKEKVRMITGAPKHEVIGTVQIKGQKTSATLPTTDDLTQFGYSVTSGRFFNKSKILFAAGAPGWNLIGQVGILDSGVDSLKLIMSIKGQVVGEYFGGSLAVGDVNNDGYDDLIIGSPHWGNDNGRVYIYFGSSNRFLEPPIIIDGPKEDSCFGYSVTSGDIDSDGYYDVIVGAPWDDNGAVYIYSGDIISNLEINIKVQEVRVKSTIRTFGFSLSYPVDIDDNGFPDIAIGAYLTGHALVLKSRPVLKTEILITSRPRTLDRNTTNFLLTICVAHFQIGKPTLESFNLKISVDETFERVNETKNSREHISKWDHTLVTVCFDKYFYLLESNKNFVDSIEVKVNHEFNNKTILKNEGEVICDLCPIEYKGLESITGELNIPFNTECGLDEVCTSSISLSANFTGVSDQLTWIIGSKDISLEIILKNEAEPAYLTTISIDLPHNIYLSSVLPFCNENTDGEFVKVTCDAGNPLTGTPRIIKIDLDMSQLNDGSLNGTTLDFNIKVNTRSQNNGDQHLSRLILLLSEFVFDLQGNAHDKNYYYSTEDKSSSNISFQHAYQLKKIGETPVLLSTLNINVPVRFQGEEIVTLTNKPRIFISGKLYKCSTHGITLMKKLVNYTPVILKEEEETYYLNVNESKPLNLKRDIDQSPEKLVPMMISNFHSQPEIMIDVNAPRIYLNCTSTDVECGKITCEIGSLNSDQDTGGLQLDFSINPVLWNYTQNTEAQIIFTTDAWIDVIKPTLEEIETVSGSNLTAYISTNIYKIDSNKNKLASIWIIVGSVFLGLLAVLLFSFILYKYGFFKRSKKEELAALKDENFLFQTDSMSEPSEL
ncbi:integrin alpha-PS3-like isoform X1 [Cotesia glomerata]|uniref:Uncharacterized protein n=1 Tax=Cotesia glomerata TaxID=32391 RepID=A0AAV7I947_COTGL|nr:integrin alpha-PS3-like isoform X1 [Cotesia glomerata]KAH0545928.1 hypothetical protein KQX54_004669 [Cotesia glomerata]